MTVLYLLLLICFWHVDSTDGTSEHGPGYVGCYPVSHAWQNVFENNKILTSVDDCVSHCNNNSKSYAAISIRSCYCSNSLAGVRKVNGLEDVLKASDSYCNVNCNSNPLQICGSCRHYSVYNMTERLRSPGFNSSLNEGTYVPFTDSTMGSTTMHGQICPTCLATSEKDSNANNEFTEEPKCCSCRLLWERIIIDVAVIFGISFLIFMVVCFCRNRHKGMFDDWQPRSSGQTRQVDSGSSRSGEDLLHRNHSYRNLSGSSTLDRSLESVEQVSTVNAASGVTALVRSFNDDSGNRYGSLPAPEKGASARSPRAVNISLMKPTTVTSAAEMENKGNSSEGGYYELDTVLAPDQPGNQPAPPDSKTKPKYNSKTCQKEPAEDKVEANFLDKSKRKSLLNIMSKGTTMPSSPRPSKDEDDFPKDPEPIMDRHRGCRYGKKNRKKSETAERRRSCSVSKDEEIFEDPKSYTLPNDIYALPNKPACRNMQPKKMSDTTKGAKSGDVEPQEGYSRLSRLFKPQAFGKGKSKRGDDTTSPEEYSVLHPDSKGTDYDKLGGHGDPDVPVTVDKAESDCKPFEGMYALEDDNRYAVVGEGMTAASQSSDYEMIAHGQMR